jgi:hypothetical protein
LVRFCREIAAKRREYSPVIRTLAATFSKIAERFGGIGRD